MIRKLLFRTMLACLAIVGLAVTSVVIAGYLAVQTPGFYQQLLAVEVSPTDEAAAELYWKQTEANFSRWLQNSLARQKSSQSQSPSPLAALAPLSMPYDPASDAHQVRISQAQLNAQLTATKATRSGDWRHPRVRFSQDRIALGFEVSSDGITCYPSLTLAPTLTDDGKLRLEIVTASIGQLPLPLKTILSYLPPELARQANSGEVAFDLSPDAPCVIVNLPTADNKSPRVSSLSCSDGELVVEFLPPELGEG